MFTDLIIKNHHLVSFGGQRGQYDNDLIVILEFQFVLSIIIKLSCKL